LSSGARSRRTAQAQAFVDAWGWNDHANAGYDEILANDQGRLQPRLIELIKGLHSVVGAGSLLAYLISISLRITEIHRVLKPNGSFYLHCDPTASHYLKLILDAIFVSTGGTSIMKSRGAMQAEACLKNISQKNTT
jgi:hypothetical protein